MTTQAGPAHADEGTLPGDMRAFGQYRLVRKLATGGMADIFLAKHVGPQGFERNVVIKRLLPQLAEDADFLTMFLDEARLAARLEHPHIVQIHDLGEIDRQYFLCMEHLAGEDLAYLIRTSARRGSPIPLRLLARIVSQAAQGLHHAHELTDEEGNPLGVVHRDVSPSNIFVTYQGHVKVLDFGIAKAGSGLATTRVGLLKGKVAYMAPERARGRPADRRSDVYSLGLCLYEALTHTKPFSGDNELAILRAVVRGRYPPVGQLRPDVPLQLEAIVQRAMARDVEARYQTAAELAAALDDALPGLTPSAATAEMRAWMKELLGEERIRERTKVPSLGALARTGGSLSGTGQTPVPQLGSAPKSLTPPSLISLPLTPPPLPSRGHTPRPLPTPGPAPARESVPPRRRRLAWWPVVCVGVGVLAFSAGGGWLGGSVVALVQRTSAPEAVPAASREASTEQPAVESERVLGLPAPAPERLLHDELPGLDTEDGTAPATAAADDGEQAPAGREPGAEQQAPAALTVEAPARSAALPVRSSEALTRPATATGRLTLDTVPWTHVYLGSHSLGETPVVEAALPAGRLTLRLENAERGIQKSLTVDIREGELTSRRVELSQSMD